MQSKRISAKPHHWTTRFIPSDSLLYKDMHSKVCACARVWCATRQVQNGDPPTKINKVLSWYRSCLVNFLSLVHAVLIQETAGQLLFLLQRRTLKKLHIFGLTWPSSSHGPSCGQWVAQEVRLQLHSRKHSMKHIILHHPEHAWKISTIDIDSGALARGKPWPKEPETHWHYLAMPNP
jgi:hypothetical protein